MADVPHPHLHHAVLSTLAAQGFQRSSSTALQATTDLLQRYMILLARSCAQQAENAGRPGITWFDAVGALEDMGTHLDELMEWASVEGRVERQVYNEEELLQEWDAHLQEGLYHDPSDHIPLIYGAPPRPESSAASTITPTSPITSPSPSPKPETEDILPLSPISLSPPASPPPKRVKWEPPEHIPPFLPPLPGVPVQEPSPEPEPAPAEPDPDDFDDLFALPHELEEKKPSVAPPPAATAATPQPIASFAVPTPYNVSSFSDLPASHLPASPRSTPPPEAQGTNPLFINAIQILRGDQHGLSLSPPAAHGLSGLIMDLTSRRYDAPDTLYAGTDPPFARHAAPTPTHVVPLNPVPQLPVPPPATKSLTSYCPPVTPEPPYLQPIYPSLAKAVLPLPVYSRVTRMNPPSLLQNNEQFLYGVPRPAPWNAHGHGPAGANGEKEGKAVEDAVLRATWGVHPRDYREGLPTRRGSRMAGLKREWSTGV